MVYIYLESSFYLSFLFMACNGYGVSFKYIFLNPDSNMLQLNTEVTKYTDLHASM